MKTLTKKKKKERKENHPADLKVTYLYVYFAKNYHTLMNKGPKID